jgi:hypothetical protein
MSSISSSLFSALTFYSHETSHSHPWVENNIISSWRWLGWACDPSSKSRFTLNTPDHQLASMSSPSLPSGEWTTRTSSNIIEWDRCGDIYALGQYFTILTFLLLFLGIYLRYLQVTLKIGLSGGWPAAYIYTWLKLYLNYEGRLES